MKKNLKYIIPSVVGIGAAAALALKKIKPKRQETVTFSATPAEYDAENLREYIEETICLNKITEEDWMLGGVKLLFAQIENNYNLMLEEREMTDIEPIWHGYAASDSGSAKYILKAAKGCNEPPYVFWEEKTGYIATMDDGLAYLLKLNRGISEKSYEEQDIEYSLYIDLLETLIKLFEIDIIEDDDLVEKLEGYILERYYELNE